MKSRKVFILISCIVIILLLIFFIKNNYNSSKKGNNISNKSADEIKEYILNIESYEAKAQVKIKSNKNENNYLLLQKYNKAKGMYVQEVVEPENIAGVKFIYDGKNLKMENTKLNLNKIYTDYKYIESHELSLASFIQDYVESEESKVYEDGKTVILETEIKDGTKYTANKKIYINKEKGKIEKMEIEDRAQNIRIYILYNEIKINELSKEEILAFSVKTIEENI